MQYSSMSKSFSVLQSITEDRIKYRKAHEQSVIGATANTSQEIKLRIGWCLCFLDFMQQKKMDTLTDMSCFSNMFESLKMTNS